MSAVHVILAPTLESIGLRSSWSLFSPTCFLKYWKMQVEEISRLLKLQYVKGLSYPVGESLWSALFPCPHIWIHWTRDCVVYGGYVHWYDGWNGKISKTSGWLPDDKNCWITRDCCQRAELYGSVLFLPSPLNAQVHWILGAWRLLPSTNCLKSYSWANFNCVPQEMPLWVA